MAEIAMGNWGAMPVLPQLQALNGGSSWLTTPGPSVTAQPGFGGPQMPSFQNPFAYTPWGQAEGLGDYLGSNAPLIMGGIQALTSGIGAYTGLKALSLARKQFQQEKKAFNINLANQTQSYNTQVADRIAGRSYATEAERQAALAAAQLTDRSTFAGKGG